MALSKLTDIRKSLSVEVEDLKVNGITTFTGNVSIGGTLTYQDVTNVDSVGIITARSNIDCDGDLDVDGHTNLDNVSIAGVSTFTGNVIVDGVLTVKSGNENTDRLQIGDSGQLRIYHAGHNYYRSSSGFHIFTVNSSEVAAKFIPNGAAELYHDNTKRFETTNAGAIVTGILTATSIEIGSNIKLGNAGIITASSYRGDGSQLTGITGTTINNNADNRVITGSGTANTLNGEGDLTFDGNQLYIDCNNYSEPILVNSTQASVRPTIRQTNDANANSGLTIQKRHSSLHPANYWYGDIQFQGWDGSGYHRAGLIECVAEGTPANDNMPGNLRFSTNSGAASQTERFRITAGGQLRLMEGNNVKMSVYNDGSMNYLTSNTGQEIKVSCGNGDSNGIEFWDYTGNNKRCQIDGHGIKFNTDTAEVNALDDYEEGSFTPTYSNTGGVTPNYNYQEGFYTKIGHLVTCAGIIGCTNANSFGSGKRIQIQLPFTCANNSYGLAGGGLADGSGFQNVFSGNTGVGVLIGGNTNYGRLLTLGSSASNVYYTGTPGLQNSHYFRFRYIYHV